RGRDDDAGSLRKRLGLAHELHGCAELDALVFSGEEAHDLDPREGARKPPADIVGLGARLGGDRDALTAMASQHDAALEHVGLARSGRRFDHDERLARVHAAEERAQGLLAMRVEMGLRHPFHSPAKPSTRAMRSSGALAFAAGRGWGALCVSHAPGPSSSQTRMDLLLARPTAGIAASTTSSPTATRTAARYPLVTRTSRRRRMAASTRT